MKIIANGGKFYDIIEVKMKDAKGGHSMKEKKKKEREEVVMVCVANHKTSRRLIRTGAKLAEQMNARLLAVNAILKEEKILSTHESPADLETLFQAANEFQAETIVFQCEERLEGLAQCARDNGVTLVVLGSSPEYATQVLNKLKEKLPTMNFIVLDSESESSKDEQKTKII